MTALSEPNEPATEAAALRREALGLRTENTALRAELAHVKRQLEALKRKLFGSARGEQVSAAQLQLALAELEQENTAQAEAPKEVIAYTRREPRPAEAQARLPEELETITEEIDVVPMKVIRRRIVRPVFVRRDQPDRAPLTAALPARVVPGGLPSAGLIAFLLVAKYVDHLPLYAGPGIKRPMPGDGLCRVGAGGTSTAVAQDPA